MYKGAITCDCDQKFYYETIRDYVICINCEKRYDLTNTQVKDKKVGD